MKKNSLRAILGLALAFILVLSAAQIPASGAGIGRRMEGTWRVQVTSLNCQTGAEIKTFPGKNTFLSGGEMIATGAISSPALMSTGHGVWEQRGERSFVNTVEFFLFRSDGSYAGIQKVTRNIELDTDSDEFTSTDTFEIIDPSGNVVATGCATGTGRRLEEPTGTHELDWRAGVKPNSSRSR